MAAAKTNPPATGFLLPTDPSAAVYPAAIPPSIVKALKAPLLGLAQRLGVEFSAQKVRALDYRGDSPQGAPATP